MRQSTWAYIFRTVSQLVFLGLTVWIAYRVFAGDKGANIERYCPFGGIETLIPWLNKKGTICSLSTLNISLMAGLLLITILFKRVFCSHICPVGAISEWLAVLRRNLPFKTGRVPRGVDRWLKPIKYVVLAVIIYFTAQTSELIFRELDPYFVLFSLGTGHGIAEGPIGVGAVSLWIIIGLLLMGLAVPLLFCRYLCPLAACLTPVSRFGAVRITRNEDTCTGCGECDEMCEWGIDVSERTVISTGECSNCQECIRACPESGTLTLNLGGGKR